MSIRHGETLCPLDLRIQRVEFRIGCISTFEYEASVEKGPE